MSIRDLLVECAERYSVPTRLHGENSFRFACRIELADSGGRSDPGDAELSVPSQVRELWAACSKAELFVDVDYAQWGLVFLGSTKSQARTQRKIADSSAEMRPGDLVIAEFLGDLDLLISTADGSILVSLPLDPRADWYQVGANLEDFLARYVASEGRKFWVSGSN